MPIVSQTPESQLIDSRHSRNQKLSFLDGWLLLFLLAIFCAIIAAVSATFLLMNKTYIEINPHFFTSTSQEQEVKGQTISSYKTPSYTSWINTQQFYSLRYPSSWNLFANSMGATIASFPGTIITTAKTLTEVPPRDEASIIITIIEDKKNDNISLMQYIQASPFVSFENKSLLAQEKLGKYNSLAYSSSARSVTYFVENKSFVYSLETIYDTPPQKEEVKKILDSFHFTSEAAMDTTHWKSYENYDIGYRFSYPQNFRVRDRGTSVTITDENNVKYIEIGTFQNPDLFSCTRSSRKDYPPATIKNVLYYVDCGTYYYGLFVPMNNNNDDEELQTPIKFYTDNKQDLQLLKNIADTFSY